MPSRREGRDAAAAATDDAAVVAIGAQIELILLRDEGQDLFVKEAHVVVADPVVFEVAIASARGAFYRRGHLTGPHEDADGHRHLLGGDGEFEVRLLTRIVAIGLHINAGRFTGVVLRRDEDGHLTQGAGEDLALRELEGLNAAGFDVLGEG
jgi:hypothetical protein